MMLHGMHLELCFQKIFNMSGFQQKRSKLKNLETLSWVKKDLLHAYLGLNSPNCLSSTWSCASVTSWPSYSEDITPPQMPLIDWVEMPKWKSFYKLIVLRGNSLFFGLTPQNFKEMILRILKVIWASDHQATQLSTVQEKLHHQTLVSEVRQMYLHFLRKHNGWSWLIYIGPTSFWTAGTWR